MAEPSRSPVVDAVARAAAELTESTGSAVAAVRGSVRTVVAVGGSEPTRTVGERPAPDDSLSFVIGGGSSIALTDAHTSVLCVPCVGGKGVVGALELRRSAAAGPFGVAATRATELLAEVVAMELEKDQDRRAGVPTPEELAGELAQLAATDRARYDSIAWALATLLGAG